MAFVALSEQGEREFSFCRNYGADTQLQEWDVDEKLIESSKVFHFGSLSFTAEPSRSAARHALKVAKEAGRIVSYDPNYRAALWPNRETAVHAMQEHLRMADIVKISREEAELITGKADSVAAIQKIWEYGPRVVLITDGKNGVTYGNCWFTGFVPSLSVEAVDTTGAGDIFFGTFLREFTKNGASLSQLNKETLHAYVTEAVRVSGLSTLKHGAIASIPEK
jgi:fructokinase